MGRSVGAGRSQEEIHVECRHFLKKANLCWALLNAAIGWTAKKTEKVTRRNVRVSAGKR